MTAKTRRSLYVRPFLPLEVRCRVIRTHYIRGRLVVKGVPLFRPTTPLLSSMPRHRQKRVVGTAVCVRLIRVVVLKNPTVFLPVPFVSPPRKR